MTPDGRSTEEITHVEEEPHDLDTAFTRLGSMGKFQLRSYTIIGLGSIPMAMTPFIVMFTGATPEHHCQLDIGEDINVTLPHTVNKLGQWKYDECNMYIHSWEELESGGMDINTSFANSSSISSSNSELVSCTHGWSYHLRDSGSTYTTEWDLVCDNAYHSALVNTIYFCGVLLGCIVASHLSDQFGRKRLLLTSTILMVVMGSASSASNGYYMFIILRFIVGLCQMGIGNPMSIYVIEIFSSSDRYISQLLGSLSWTSGMMLLAGIAYVMRHLSWRYLQLVIALLHVPFMFMYAFILPESLYWLVSKHKIEDAERILMSAAKLNGVTLREECLSTHRQQRQVAADWAYLQQGGGGEAKGGKENGTADKRGLILLFSHRKYMVRTLALFVMWITNCLVYMGLSLNATAFSGDKYLNFFLTALAEIPAAFVATVMLKYRRRMMQSVAFFISGAPLITIGILLLYIGNTAGGHIDDVGPAITILTMIGKFGITLSWNVILLYAPEVYPTACRNAAVGLAGAVGTVGSMMSPFAEMVNKWEPTVVPFTFGALSLLSMCLTLLLPETLHCSLTSPPGVQDDLHGDAATSSAPSTPSTTPTTLHMSPLRRAAGGKATSEEQSRLLDGDDSDSMTAFVNGGASINADNENL